MSTAKLFLYLMAGLFSIWIVFGLETMLVVMAIGWLLGGAVVLAVGAIFDLMD